MTSPMDAARCAVLLDSASSCLVAETDGAVTGFALVMYEGDSYDGENFAWFGARLHRFAYVDRIVISPAARGMGLGKRFYARIEAEAREAGCLTFAAEISCLPPNEPSLAFHEARGFAQIGTRSYPGGKMVSMQIKGLSG